MRPTDILAALAVAFLVALQKPPAPPLPDGAYVRIEVKGSVAGPNTPPPVLHIPGEKPVVGVRRLERTTTLAENYAVRPLLRWSGYVAWNETLAVESAVGATVVVLVPYRGASCTFGTWMPGRTRFRLAKTWDGVDIAVTHPNGRKIRGMCLRTYRPLAGDHTG